MTPQSEVRDGRAVLVVEDDYFLAGDIARAFAQRGDTVIGPVSSVRDALALVAATARLDGAVLDINLQGEMTFPIADALAERGVLFVFVTGYDRSIIPPRHAGVASYEKPLDPARIAAALFGD